MYLSAKLTLAENIIQLLDQDLDLEDKECLPVTVDQEYDPETALPKRH